MPAVGRRPQRRKRRLAKRNRVVCPSGKVGYLHGAAAEDALAIINGPDSRHAQRHRPAPITYYSCRLCGAYHLTSRPRRGDVSRET